MRPVIRYQSQLLYRKSYAASRLMPRGGSEPFGFQKNHKSR